MIKRDTIQRVVMITTEDEMGGNTAIKEPKEIIKAHVSQTTTFGQIVHGQITQYGVKEQIILNVVTDVKLDEYVNTRYIYSDKLYRLMRQVKSGNEYFSVLMEVNE